MKKNVASQVIGVQMITAADGTAFTGAVTALITVDGGTQSASGGTGPTHEGNGFHTYLPTQAETNGDHIGFTFTGSGAIPATVQVYTNFPQTVDNNVLAAGATGFAAIDTVVDAILVDTAEIGAAGAGLTAINLPNQTMDIVGNITGNLSGSVGSVTGAVGSVTGAVASVTGAVGSVAGNVDGSVASVTGAVGSVTGAVGSVTGHTAQTGDSFAIVNGAAGLVAIDTVVDAIKVVTDALGSAGAANLALSAAGIISGTAQTGTFSTTVMTTDLTGYVNDELIGRTVIWTGGDANGQASDITDYASASGTVTYTAITTLPANGDTFVIV